MDETTGEFYKKNKEKELPHDKEKGELKDNKNGLTNINIKNPVYTMTYNKFKNDGTFLEQVLALQKEKKIRKSKILESSDLKKKKAKLNEQSSPKPSDTEVENNKEFDKREQEIKNEYIEKMKKMKEQGYFTDKGIGAGLVK